MIAWLQILLIPRELGMEVSSIEELLNNDGNWRALLAISHFTALNCSQLKQLTEEDGDLYENARSVSCAGINAIIITGERLPSIFTTLADASIIENWLLPTILSTGFGILCSFGFSYIYSFQRILSCHIWR